MAAARGRRREGEKQQEGRWKGSARFRRTSSRKKIRGSSVKCLKREREKRLKKIARKNPAQQPALKKKRESHPSLSEEKERPLKVQKRTEKILFGERDVRIDRSRENRELTTEERIG